MLFPDKVKKLIFVNLNEKIAMDFFDEPKFEPLRVLFDNTPLDDFCGMTFNEIRNLLYSPFDETSPLKINSDIDDDTLNNIPFFRLTEELLKIVQREKHVKLTPLGALPKKVLHELYEYKFIPEFLINAGISTLNREHDAISIMTAHYATRISGILKKVKGNLFLSKSGLILLNTEKRINFFLKVLKSFTTEFNWATNDGYSDFQIGQFGWGYTIFLLYKFGDAKRTKQFYADMFLKAFPKFIEMIPRTEEFNTQKEDFINCYILRSFERFVEWFGFAENCNKGFFEKNNDLVIRMDALLKVFRFDI